ncbi:MAG TPA: LON peptidase substrate-binding domain-containing protein, partial [Chloroflexia bacterium]|nr:LON peptidase substrate-binding domain-containing protein [Chloroflexia bacterium]
MVRSDKAEDLSPDIVEYPLLPLKNVVVFPRTIVNLTIGRTRSVQALNLAMSGNRCLIVDAQRDFETDEPDPEHLYDVGTLVEVRQVRRQADATLQVEVEALRRVRIEHIVQEEPCFTASVEFIPERPSSGRDTDTLMQQLGELFEKYSTLNSKVPADAAEHIRAARQPGYMADLLAAHLVSDVHDRQKVLEMSDQGERLQYMASVLINSIDIIETEQRVRDKVRASLDKNQREFYLREQLKAIHDELSSEGGNEMAEIREKLEARGLPPETLARMLKEVNRLERMPSVSPESTVLRNYIDWALVLPWKERTEDRIDLPLAEQVLEEDHYGLGQVKERILDYLAVRQLTMRKRAEQAASADGGPEASRQQGAILCFVGPPGVGKTSLGQSIATAMNRKFVRLSLGGVHDEAEIRGHRRTYVGAMPGRIIQSMKQAGTINP